MRVFENIDLSSRCTFHVGGLAEKYYEPENEDELTGLAADIYRSDGRVYILSGGSNLLINDKTVFSKVISMRIACLNFIDFGDGRFYIGASLSIQKVIHDINNLGYGGIEELIGLPALFGGIVYMNAGIGGESRSLFTIGQFIEKVKVYNYKSESIEWIPSNNCEFGHRKSIFQNDGYLILGAEVKFQEQPFAVSEEKIKMRQKFCKENFEYGKGCFGTCFSKSSGKLLNLAAKLSNGGGCSSVVSKCKLAC